jgi:hypothetical protein
MKTGKILLLIIIIFGIISCNTNQKKPPMAKQGILDLRNWDFEKDGNVRLDGDWEFYWHEFLSSKDFDTVQQKHYIKVPKPWNDYKWGKEELGYEGYATYRLRIIVNKNIRDFGLKFPDQGTAFELYLNDSLVGKNGKIGKTRETSEPQYLPLLIPFKKTGDTITIVCKISNYDFHFGGFYFAAEIGEELIIRLNKENKVISDYVFASLLLLISLILLIFFLLRPKDYLSLLFSICSFTSAFRTISVGEKIISKILPNLDWEWCIRIEGLSWMLWGVFLVWCFRMLLNMDYSKILTFIYSISYVIISLITLLTPARFNSQIIIIAQILAFSWILYSIPIFI